MLNENGDGKIKSENEADMMICLYYVYVPIPKEGVKPHSTFHEKVCQELNLFGRIRISFEGINGVLSGNKDNLKKYETKLQEEVLSLAPLSERYRYGETLDVKYCHLRDDIPVDKQKFDSLSVKLTSEVVSLSGGASQKDKKKKKKRRSRKNKGQMYQKNTCEAVHNNEISTVSGAQLDDKEEKKAVLCLSEYSPAEHLEPEEWNKKLLEDRLGTDSEAILIDARNAYESKIGHFRVEGVPTLLTNTRKYSTIPSVFKASASDMAGKNVYMYCTGGVRCERASVYLQALSESGEWPEDLEKPKGIYQLQGGIQKYLERYGRKDNEDKSEVGIQINQKEECLYAGRNFVFDQRRMDPIVGKDGKAVGRCLLCSIPHDDYDNGHAPSDNKEGEWTWM